MIIFELPPAPRGDEAQQIADLRAYLQRLVLQMQEEKSSEQEKNRAND